jgi:hypothetical protein
MVVVRRYAVIVHATRLPPPKSPAMLGMAVTTMSTSRVDRNMPIIRPATMPRICFGVSMVSSTAISSMSTPAGSERFVLAAPPPLGPSGESTENAVLRCPRSGAMRAPAARTPRIRELAWAAHVLGERPG